MKIAICLFGFFRTFKEVEDDFIKNIAEPTNCDIFICSPSTYFPESTVDDFHDFSTKKNERLELEELKIRKYIKWYNIYDYYSEPYKNIVTDNNLPESFMIKDFEAVNSFENKDFFLQMERVYPTWRSFSMYHHIENVLKIKNKYEEDNNFKYDLVILARPDLRFNKEITNLDTIENNKMYLTLNREFTHYAAIFVENSKRKFFCDHFMVGKSEVFDNFLNLTDDSLKIFKEENILPNNETILGYRLLKNDVDIEYIDLITYNLTR